MAKQLQLRGGTTAQHALFTGAAREITIDTDAKVIVVHDGVTPGGFPVISDTLAQLHFSSVTNPHSVTKAQVGLGSADNTADSAKNVLSATKLTTARTIAISGDATGTATSFNGSANISIPVTLSTVPVAKGGTGVTTSTGTGSVVLSASPTLTGTVVLPSTTSIGTVSSTEIGYLDGVTSAVQTQIDTKQTAAQVTAAITAQKASSTVYGVAKISVSGSTLTITTV